MVKAQNLANLCAQIDQPWTPFEVARYNDQLAYLAMFEGEYHWHSHEYDELFQVVSGTIEIQIEGDDNCVLTKGETAVIPAGVRHCPRSKERSFVLLFEPLNANLSGN